MARKFLPEARSNTAHSEVEFKHPLYVGDRPVVKITAFKVGRTSVGLRYKFTVDETECVEARMTVVCAALDGLRPVPIPPQYKEKFEELLEEG